MFTDEELNFLIRHNISIDQVLDVRGWQPREWRHIAKDDGCDFVLCSPGKNCSHRIKTRRNSCCQCRPAPIAFMKRHEAPGWFYLAYSESAGLLKTGTTGNHIKRLASLRSQGYGDATDWEMIALCFVDQGGAVEWDLWRAIDGAPVISGYRNRFSGETNRELLEGDPWAAVQSFRAVAKKSNGRSTWINPNYAR